jgi:hypothetical protein
MSDLLGPFLSGNASAPKPLSVAPSIPTKPIIPVTDDADFLAAFPEELVDAEPQSTVELVPTADRYDVFRELNVEDKPQPTLLSDDDFGDFKTSAATAVLSKLDTESIHSFESMSDEHSESTSPIIISNEEDILKVWTQAAQAVKQIVHKSFNTLVVNHGQDCSIEAMSSNDGRKFRSDLEQVYFVAKRIEHAFKSRLNVNTTDTGSMQLAKLLGDIEITYKTLTKLFLKCSTLDDLSNLEANRAGSKKDSKCTICRSNLKIGFVNLIVVAGGNYHASCANLWTNYVTNSLPVNSEANSV